MSVAAGNTTSAVDQNGAARPASEAHAPDDRSVLTPEKVDSILAAAKKLGENPLFDEYLRAVEEYRRLNNTVPDAD